MGPISTPVRSGPLPSFTSYLCRGPTRNDARPSESTDRSSTVMPLQGRTWNTFDSRWYGTTACPERREPSTTKRYSPAGVASGRSPVSNRDTNAPKGAVPFRAWSPPSYGAVSVVPFGNASVVGSSPDWSAYGSHESPTRRSTRTTGLSVKFEPPTHVNSDAPKRSTSAGWVTTDGSPPSSGSESSYAATLCAPI